MRLRSLLAAASVFVLSAQALAVDCAEWSAPGFFSLVTAAEVRECLEAGADVNARDQAGRSPLHNATALNSDPAVTEALLAAGADVNAQGREGGTPLHGAAALNK